ncbi:unnamed protein product [Moneuplotes crassus]|uniref:Enoyl reductase (ER) domain-containing protein n=1 Tax=Euplotes crassus TaxID=5936 RepID=A0AAD1XKU8_EUPCR|nr:unnamed protein product [Moneuplotes crassus]
METDTDTHYASVNTDMTKPLLKTDNSLRELGENEVLVKIHSAPINPSDTYNARGVYGMLGGSTDGHGIGFDGAGEVLKVGKGVDEGLVGKRVAVGQLPFTPGYEGSWRQYLITLKDNLMIYPDDADFDKICSSFVNPITVCTFLHHIEKNKYKAIIQTAASSSLGKMLHRLCLDKDVKIINIVRKDEQVKALEDLGSTHTVNSNSETFKEDLAKAIEELQPTALFDPVGGELSKTILMSMPTFSTLYIYGSLDTTGTFTYNNRELLSKRATLMTVFATDLAKFCTPEELQSYYELVSKDIYEGGKIFGTEVVSTHPLSDFEKAIAEREASASQGKIILKPWE